MWISETELLEIANRSMERASHSAHFELKKGLAALATIASTAPFIGLFGTVLGLINAFRGYIGERTELLVLTSIGVQQALLTTALGLLVAVPAVWSYNYFAETLERFQLEMEIVSLELANYLVIHRRRNRNL